MKPLRRLGQSVAWSAAIVGVLALAQRAEAQWPQWGGANRNFTADSKGLADAWPQKGPKRVWKKRLGDGYSGIVVDSGRLYTMYRKGKTPFEVTVCLDAQTGEKVWEHKYASPVPTNGKDHPGPHSTPLIWGRYLFSIGRNAVMHCFNKDDGKVLWARDLVAKDGARFSEWGYSPSPIAYKETVILPVARRRPNFHNVAPRDRSRATDAIDVNASGRTLMAFAQDDGEVVWASQDYGMDHSSPVLISGGGQDQIVMLTPEVLFSVAPESGSVLWRKEFDRASGRMMTPVWLKNELLFVSTPDRGSQAFALSNDGGRISPNESWFTRKLRVVFLNPVAVGEYVIGSSGRSPAVLTAIDITTGEQVWADRSFAQASLLFADGKLIILDEEGYLGLATATREGLTVHSKCKITARESFTAPTLVGCKLYVRDRKDIMALDLG
ncbi:MAG: PQQ-binding-like beta-propeller repeat protein [Phycisphaerales bacterium]|nr:MAG: PQQ-binding-like beta-propeller repeat protein [Phycisphaerales bacterium]